MEVQEFKNKLDGFSKYIVVPKGNIDKQSTDVLEFIKFYQGVTGEKIVDGTCKDCILEAFYKLKTLTENQLKTLIMKKKYIIKKGKVVGFKQDHFTNANITDQIAFDMVAFNRSNAGNFENADELLADFDAAKGNSIISRHVVTEEKKEVVTAPVTPVSKGQDTPTNKTVSVTEKNPLKVDETKQPEKVEFKVVEKVEAKQPVKVAPIEVKKEKKKQGRPFKK